MYLESWLGSSKTSFLFHHIVNFGEEMCCQLGSLPFLVSFGGILDVFLSLVQEASVNLKFASPQSTQYLACEALMLRAQIFEF